MNKMKWHICLLWIIFIIIKKNYKKKNIKTETLTFLPSHAPCTRQWSAECYDLLWAAGHQCSLGCSQIEILLQACELPWATLHSTSMSVYLGVFVLEFYESEVQIPYPAFYQLHPKPNKLCVVSSFYQPQGNQLIYQVWLCKFQHLNKEIKYCF